MNKMKQDNLLPYVESGLLIIVGCTTANPYHSINPAIRSRCQIVEVKPLQQEHIIQGLHKALESEKGYHKQYTCDEEVFKHIARLSSGIFVLPIIVLKFVQSLLMKIILRLKTLKML